MSKAQIKTLKENKEKFKSQKDQILQFIKSKYQVTEYQIKALFNFKRCAIIGRLSELQDDGLIYVSDTFNGNKNSIYKYEPCPIKQNINKSDRETARFKKWEKLGQEKGYLKRLLK